MIIADGTIKWRVVNVRCHTYSPYVSDCLDLFFYLYRICILPGISGPTLSLLHTHAQSHILVKVQGSILYVIVNKVTSLIIILVHLPVVFQRHIIYSLFQFWHDLLVLYVQVFDTLRTTVFILGMVLVFIGISLLAPDEPRGMLLCTWDTC